MGLLFGKVAYEYNNNKDSVKRNIHANKSLSNKISKKSKQNQNQQKCYDLTQIPSEISLKILKYLNATDLCLASCVWSSLASDDILWKCLCKKTWSYASIYNKIHLNYNFKNKAINCNQKHLVHVKSGEKVSSDMTFKRIFLKLDEATLTFNGNWKNVN
jgi:F-box protein 8